jgi:hypothetical protein
MRGRRVAGVILLGTMVASCWIIPYTWDADLSNDRDVIVICKSTRVSFWNRPEPDTDERFNRCIAACQAHGFRWPAISRVQATAIYEHSDPDEGPERLPAPCL